MHNVFGISPTSTFVLAWASAACSWKLICLFSCLWSYLQDEKLTNISCNRLVMNTICGFSAVMNTKLA